MRMSRSSLVAFIWNHIRWHGTAALSLQASLSLSVPLAHARTHARAFPTLQLHARAPRPPAQLDGQVVKAGVN